MADLIKKKGKYWYANCTYKGERLRDSLKTDNSDTAVIYLGQLFAAVDNGNYQLHKTLFDKLKKSFDPKVNRVNKLRIVRLHIAPCLKGQRISEIDIQTWAEGIARKHTENTATSILGVAVEMGFTIDYKNLEFKPGKIFTSEQIPDESLVLRVLESLLSRTPTNKYYPIARAAAYSGMPLSDLLHLTKEQVVFTGDKAGITYIRRKTRHKKQDKLLVPMSNKLREAFRTAPTPIFPKDLWFPFPSLKYPASAISEAVGETFIKCGWDHGGAMHQFRHFAASYLLNEGGVDLHIVQQLLGHSRIETTRRYARTQPTTLIEGVKKAFNG